MAGALDSGRQRVSCGRLAWGWPHTGPGAGGLWPSPSLARVVWLPARLYAACRDLLGGPGVLSPPGLRGPRCQTCFGRQVKGPPAVTPQGRGEAVIFLKNIDNIIMVVVHITGSMNQKVLLYKQLFW